MPKLVAPHEASWRGRKVAAGKIIDVSADEARELRAHGFRDSGETEKKATPKPAPANASRIRPNR